MRHGMADLLSSKGFFEIMTNSLGSAAHSALIPELDPAAGVGILNPLSAELDQLRQSLIFNGLQAIAYNLNRRNSDLKLYEFGRIYERDRSEEHTSELQSLMRNSYAVFCLKKKKKITQQKKKNNT